jgi:16S rRNA (uracil1498-N3)-methyltransferase
MQRYFIAPDRLTGTTVVIDGGDFHHIKNVMRMRSGDRITVCPGDGKAYLTEIEGFSKGEVMARLISEIPEDPEMKVRVTIAHGVVKTKKQEEVVRRLAELGADAYLPVYMERSIVKAGAESAAKAMRLTAIAKEACEQSQRTRLLRILPPVNFDVFLNHAKNYAVKIYAYEEICGDVSLKSALSDLKDGNVIVLIGPEGGISPTEAERLSAEGFTAVGLGPRILRTETAPLYLMSVISYATEL